MAYGFIDTSTFFGLAPGTSVVAGLMVNSNSPLGTPLNGFSSAVAQQQVQLQSLGVSALQRGAVQLAGQHYDAAVDEFRRAIAYDPALMQAYDALGNTYTLMGRPADTIATLQKATQIDPTNADTLNQLAYAFLSARQYPDAEQAFRQLERLEPASAGPPASLGYLDMTTGRLDEARTEFDRALELSPRDPAAHYSAGLLDNVTGRYDEAASQFQLALQLRPGYVQAMDGLARAYLGLGRTDAAMSEVAELDASNDPAAAPLAQQIRSDLYLPRMMYIDPSRSTFDTSRPPGTPVASLDPSLATPGASHTFTVTIQFNQAMDASSVSNPAKWSIARAAGGPGGAYDNGALLHPELEAGILPMPLSVHYDPGTLRATLTFSIAQNATGDAVIDPSHWVFRCFGVSASGVAMDPKSDQLDGWRAGGF